MNDQLTTITLTGDHAAAERQRLLADGTEVNLVCRRRDARGRDVSRSLFFGICDECAWVASQSLKDSGDICIEIGFLNQVQQLFAAHVGRVMTAKVLTDSDPRSPECFDLNPGIETFTADMMAALGIQIDPWE